jgi:hypothetical protein
MVNRSVLGFTNRRTKEQASTAFGTDASVTLIPGRHKPLSAEEQRERLVAHLDVTTRRPMSKEGYEKLNELLAAAKAKKSTRRKMSKKVYDNLDRVLALKNAERRKQKPAK